MKELEEQSELNLLAEKDDEEVNIEYDIASYPSDYTLRGLNDMFKSEDISIPGYQRGYVWTIKQASLLIESFLVGLPVPPIFLYIDEENKNLVIDGQQRLLSIVFFFEGYFGAENRSGKRQVFKLSGLNKRNRFYNKRFVDLEEKDKRKLEGSVLRAINIRQLSPKDESTCVYHIFERLNTGGTPLKPQEIRNCVFSSQFIRTLQSLNLDNNWRTILSQKNISKNQADVELILRTYAFAYYLSSYEKPMKEFLNKVAKVNKRSSEHINEFSINFVKAASLVVQKLPEKPFNARGPFNASLFDSVFCTILNNIDNLPGDLSDRFQRLISDEKFVAYTSLATTDEKIVKERFNLVHKFLISNE